MAWKNQSTSGLQNLASQGRVRISVKAMGFDKAYSKLTAIPPAVNRNLHNQIKKNAQELRDLAKLYVPFLTGALHDSIKLETKGGWLPHSGAKGLDWVSQISTNTSYAFYVEEDIHPSYKTSPPPPSVFGRKQGPPQGPHFLARAMADCKQTHEVSNVKAVEKAIHTVVRGLSGKYDKFTGGYLDFNTRSEGKATRFVESALNAGLAGEMSSGMINLPNLGLNIQGFD